MQVEKGPVYGIESSRCSLAIGDNAGGGFITIDINDLDDNATTAPGDTDVGANTVVENATSGTVGVTMNATDDDATAGAISYAIVGGTGENDFDINTSTGVVTVASGANIDRESDATLTLQIQASPDNGADSTITTVTIDVTDVDEIDVSTPVDINAADETIAENATSGTMVGYTASASDADATTNGVTYSLVDDAGGRRD